MKKLLYILFFFSSSLLAQNLVANPSFEQFTSCPDNLCQIHRATGWSAWGYSPDYFNSCGIYPWSPVSAPYNIFGFQNPATGNAYAGFYAYDSLNSPSYPNLREYPGIQLSSQLVIGQKYYVKFKISSADIMNNAVNKIGALFSTVPFALDSSTACTNTTTSLIPNNFAHVYSPLVISDTANWTTISGSFIADSAYQFISIGNHFDDANSTHILIYNDDAAYAAYYYLDDVYVGTDSTEGINDYDLQNKIIIYPNPAKEQITIHGLTALNEKCEVKIFNALGALVIEQQIIFKESISLPLGNLSAGIYLIIIEINQNRFFQKFIKA